MTSPISRFAFSLATAALASTAALAVAGSTTRDVPTTPIWNQSHAQSHCPQVCTNEGGDWTGHWTNISGADAAVCNCRFTTVNHQQGGSFTVEAGALWNQAHADNTCPSVCDSQGGRWNGHWWTTRPGEMSVCSCVAVAPQVEEVRVPGTRNLYTSAGGQTQAAQLFGGGCRGWIDTNPNFVLVVSHTGPVTVQGASNADTTLVLNGPGGTFCDDDGAGNRNPQIAQQLPAGRYNVYLGAYQHEDIGSPVTVRVQGGQGGGHQGGGSYGGHAGGGRQSGSQHGGSGHSGGGHSGGGHSGASSYGTLRLPGEATGAGSPGGPINAAWTHGGACVGQIAERPDHILELAQAGPVRLEANSAMDTSLVLVGPDGVVCDDDSAGGHNPRIWRTLSAGTWRVFVGAVDDYSGSGRYTISARSETAPNRGGSYGNPGSGRRSQSGYDGAAADLQLPGEVYTSGLAGGRRAAEQLYGGDCRGYIGRRPNHRLNLAAATRVHLGVRSEEDTTLVMVGPSGVVCRDDDDDRNPVVDQVLAAGTWDVFVGTYHQADSGTPYSIEAWTEGRRSSGRRSGSRRQSHSDGVLRLPGNERVFGLAGGSVDASSTYGGECRGYVDFRPNHRMRVTEPGPVRLAVSAQEDTTLVIVGPNGTYCRDDDDGNRNPILDQPLPEGLYDVYVGTYHSSDRGTPYTIDASGAGRGSSGRRR